jgi:hypothetical protein
MKKTTTIIALLALAGCSGKKQGGMKPFSGSDNDSPIIISDTSTGTLGNPPPQAINAIKVERQNVNFWSKPFYDDGNGHYQIHGNGTLWLSRYKAACVEVAGSPLTPLAKDTPWSLNFLDSGQVAFTIQDGGDNNSAIDPKGAPLQQPDSNTLITSTSPKTFQQVVVTSGSQKTEPLSATVVTVHYCPNGQCAASNIDPCKP